MLTFLPFLRAVKAHTRSALVYALIFGAIANCARHGVMPISDPTSGAPLVQASKVAAPQGELWPGAAPSASSSNAGGEPSSPPLADPAAIPELRVEMPYPSDAKGREAEATESALDDDELARWNVGGSSDPSGPLEEAAFHPGTRVIVETRLAKHRLGAPPSPLPRGLTLQRVQAQTRSHGYWPFRRCFEAAVTGEMRDESAGSETRVAFTIGLRGKVRAARLLDSRFGAPRAANCVVREVSKLEFSPPPQRALAIVASIRMYPGDVALLSPIEARSFVAPEASGPFNAEAMRALIENKLPALAACFREARRADKNLWGRLALALILETDGSVHRVSQVESHFPNAGAVRCIQATLAEVAFPSINGKPFSFVVALRLSPLRGSEPSPERSVPSSVDSLSDDD